MDSCELSVRPLDPNRDYPRVAELRNLFEAEKVTPERMRQMDEERSLGGFAARMVAEIEGHIVAAGWATRNLWHPPGLYRVIVRVDPGHHRKGHGSGLLRCLEAVAIEDGAKTLEAIASDGDGDVGLSFLKKNGYDLVAHTYESTLDLIAFEVPDPIPMPEIPGLRIFSFAETAMDEPARRLLWDLNVETSRDEPHNDPDYRPAFEQFQESVIEASWFDPRGQFVAAIGDAWIGLSAVGEVYEGSLYNLFTGVRRPYRGLGLARALKLVATRFAKESGKTYIRTSNDSRNTPMLAINAGLGYKSESGFCMARKNVAASG
ncbi:MAG TPA: GNAT family N-acetyltransferase [Fimbriimonadaceae bacterium]|nr:GNAT family N-acetyltransferase [Fimbriimonadaceae bacterium]